MDLYDVIIVGGGLAGLTAALHLRKENYNVILFECQDYPNHKVCGEYISKEVVSYLEFLGVSLPKTFELNQLLLSNTKGKALRTKLPLGGLGLSRYTFDHLLYKKAMAMGTVVVHEQVTNISYELEKFEVSTESGKTFAGKIVIGAYGKRGSLDKQLKRNFIYKKSPWLGVKAHYKMESFPDDLVAIHNFRGGYGGLSKIESGAINFCYLTTYDSFKKEGDMVRFEHNVIMKNPFLNSFLMDAKMLFDNPLAIGQISFCKKNPVENHILMCGDTAGLIHPLCGNGMAMAIHSAKIASQLIHGFFRKASFDRQKLEQEYETSWQAMFRHRLWVGRQLQQLMIHEKFSNCAMGAMACSPYILKKLIKNTHGPIIHCS